MSTEVFPACLSFLTIYNPALSVNDENLHDQIVYYHSGSTESQARRKDPGDVQPETSHEEHNERLRQIGLAQGMIEFAKSFSNGDAVDFVETAKCRILLHELEAGWWILASVNLTRLVNFPGTQPNANGSLEAESNVEYSAREVCPPALLLQQLLRAHRIFLLHHSPSLTDLYARFTRPRFCYVLKRYWDNYVLNWDLLLNGNPAVDVFNGLKLAAGGELGIGVGEEEWGSGEREVLEDFVRRTDGLVDLIVSRFGDGKKDHRTSDSRNLLPDPTIVREKTVDGWQGGRQHPRPSDGVIFSGIGAITRSSIRDISVWVELLYKYGQRAYGVHENPAAARKKRRGRPPDSLQGECLTPKNPSPQRRKFPSRESSHKVTTNSSRNKSISPPKIPPPIVRPKNLSSDINNSPPPARSSSKAVEPGGIEREDTSSTGADTLMKYLTLGIYGSTWGMPSRRVSARAGVSHISKENKSIAHLGRAGDKTQYAQEYSASYGHFLIGLQGELEQGVDYADDEGERKPNANHGSLEDQGRDEQGRDEQGRDEQGSNQRTMLRTLQVQRHKQISTSSSSSSTTTSLGSAGQDDKSVNQIENAQLRVVVYVQEPFIFTFLFELHTDSLAMPTFYHSIHHQLGPLQRPLLVSTSPQRVFERLSEASIPKSTTPTSSSEPIWDLVYNPANLAVHTTIPNIPELGVVSSRDSGPQATVAPWTRAEALSVHLQILNTYSSTRRCSWDLERTCKTGRGWWVVWMKLPSRRAAGVHDGLTHDEAFLVRKASDYMTPATRAPRGLFGLDLGGNQPSTRWGPTQLAEGIGIDARQYIDGLLSLNR